MPCRWKTTSSCGAGTKRPVNRCRVFPVRRSCRRASPRRISDFDAITMHGRSLGYPDRLVQFAAAEALLRIPAAPPANAAGRVVDVLRRYAAIDPQPKARRPVMLLGFPDPTGSEAIAQAARQAGFDVEKVD